MTDLRQAAQAVVDRWDTPAWEWSEKGPTADLIAALRKALEQQQADPVAVVNEAIRVAWSAGYVEGEKATMEKRAEPECWCHKCNDNRLANYMRLNMPRMILCPTCGNKRCPKASDHRLDCTGSNEPGQPGSVYTTLPQQQAEPVGYWDGEFSGDGGATLYEVPQLSVFGRKYRNVPLYTAPPQRKELTEQQIKEAVLDDPIGGTALASMLRDEVTVAQLRQAINLIARAIEAAQNSKEQP